MSRHLFVSIAAFVLISLNGPTANPVAAAEGEPVNFTQKVKSQQQKIKRVQKGIEDHKELIRHSRVMETNLFEQQRN